VDETGFAACARAGFFTNIVKLWSPLPENYVVSKMDLTDIDCEDRM